MGAPLANQRRLPGMGLSIANFLKPFSIDRRAHLRYDMPASGWDRRGRIRRTLSGPRGSSSKVVTLGAAGKPARRIY